jgi:hypothetical protein
MNKPSLIMISGILSLSIQGPTPAAAQEKDSDSRSAKPEMTLKERLQLEKVTIEKREVTKSVECMRCSLSTGK